MLHDLLEPPACEVAVLYDRHTPVGALVALVATVPLFGELTTGHGWLLVTSVAELLDAEVH